jgi:hypothetical protein
MAIVSPLVLALGIANIALTNQWYCPTYPHKCNPLTTGIALTWAAVGIWASIPVSSFKRTLLVENIFKLRLLPVRFLRYRGCLGRVNAVSK